MNIDDEAKKIRDQIVKYIKGYYDLKHAKKEFIPGKSRISYAGRIYDEKEMIAAVDSILDFWLTIKDKNLEFCDKFSKFLNIKNTIFN